MTTLVEFMILSGTDNHPPMLEKDLYDSWQSRMELYMENRERGRNILESVKNGPLIWPTIEENGVTRTKKYDELSATEKTQANCDIKATNIILQGLPSNVYALVNHHRIAKDLWERIQLLMQGTSLTKQERESENNMHIYKMTLQQFQVNTKFLNSLPHEWSKFVTDVKLVRDFHTTNFDQLHAYLQQHELHANEVRLMHEPVTYPSAPYPNAYSSIVHQDACPQPPSIPQIEYSVSIVNQQTHLAEFPQIDFGLAVFVFNQGDDPIDAINKMMPFMSTVVSSRFPSTNNQLRNSSNPRQQATIHDGRVTCPKPKRKMDATWFRDKVLLVEAQGSGKVLNEEELAFLADPRVVEGRVTQTVITHNAAYQADNLDAYDSDCDDIFIAQAIFMANLSSYGSDVLSESVTHKDSSLKNMIGRSGELNKYLAIIRLMREKERSIQDTNSSVQQDAMILSVFEQLLNQVTNCNKGNKDNLIANESLSAELERYKNQKNAQFADFEKEINSLKQTLSEQLKEKETLTKTFNVFKNESKEKKDKNIEKEIPLEKKVKELDNIVCKMGQSAQTVHMLTKPQVFYDNNLKQAFGFQNPFYLKKAQQIRPMLYDGNVITKETNVISIADSEETLMLEEESRSKMVLKQSDPMVLEKKVNVKPIDYAALNRLSEDFGKCFVPQALFDEQDLWLQNSYPITDQSASSPVKIEAPRELSKVSLVNTSLKKLKYHLGQFDIVVKKWITPNALTEGEWGFEHTKAIFQQEIIPFLKTLKDVFNVFDQDLLNESVEITDLNAQLQEKVLAITSLENDLRKLKGKDIVDNAAQMSKATTIAPGLYKLDPVTLAPKSMFDATHDLCFLKFVSVMNACSKSKSVKKAKKKEVWKPTGKVFTKIGYNWRPTGRTFTLVGNVCPLTRITATKKVPFRKPTPPQVVALEPVLTKIYTRRPNVPNPIGSFRKPKIAKSMILTKRNLVYYVEGLGHNLFSVGQLCGSNLEVAFRKHSCFVHNLEGVDLLSGSRETNLYTLSIGDMMASSLICLLSKASKTKSWLWNRHDYSRFTWVKFLASKDEAPNFIIKILKMIQVRLNATVRNICTDNGNQRNRTLVEAARTMLIYAKALLFLWAEAVATASLCYPTNDSENLGKLQAKADIGIFIRYAPKKKACRIYNRRTRKIIETIQVDFDELTAMASEQSSLEPALHEMTPATLSLGLVP
ncbi:retrovirus-related pol polyprotein from transposon TNT 1-94, partial [Tanacetum coccineum]